LPAQEEAKKTAPVSKMIQSQKGHSNPGNAADAVEEDLQPFYTTNNYSIASVPEGQESPWSFMVGPKLQRRALPRFLDSAAMEGQELVALYSAKWRTECNVPHAVEIL
jgi:hypothetical protein